MDQQNHFSADSFYNGDNATESQRLQTAVQNEKRSFWKASDIAWKFRFEVKEKYTDWLNISATPEKR
jgi:hypothetical protein